MTPQQVRALRIKAGLKQRECAEMFGLTLYGWQKKETNYKDPKNNSAISKAEAMVLERLAKRKI